MYKQLEYFPKTMWGEGPWQNEPDRLEFRLRGYPCLLQRNVWVSGAWCGYVAVPPKHPYYRKPYNKLNHVLVHGGLTYADHCQEGGHICHIPKQGESDKVWWLGFDCAHSDDFSPRSGAFLSRMSRQIAEETGVKDLAFLSHYSCPWETYKDVTYVVKQVLKLVRQCQMVAKPLHRIRHVSTKVSTARRKTVGNGVS